MLKQLVIAVLAAVISANSAVAGGAVGAGPSAFFVPLHITLNEETAAIHEITYEQAHAPFVFRILGTKYYTRTEYEDAKGPNIQIKSIRIADDKGNGYTLALDDKKRKRAEFDDNIHTEPNEITAYRGGTHAIIANGFTSGRYGRDCSRLQVWVKKKNKYSAIKYKGKTIVHKPLGKRFFDGVDNKFAGDDKSHAQFYTQIVQSACYAGRHDTGRS